MSPTGSIFYTLGIERKVFVERPGAKGLLLTVLGELVLPRGGSAWTQSLVGTLGLLGVEERNARQSLARVAADGYLDRHREGRRVRWDLSPAGRRLLSSGARRIYSLGAAAEAWDGRWLVVLCSVADNATRARLRTRLGFLGFGFLPGGVAVSAHVERELETVEVLKALGVNDAVVLRAEASDLQPLERAWDIDGLAAAYRAFLTRRWPADPLAALVLLVHEWRRFPSIDPELPEALLPPRWPGRRAKARFEELRTLWTPDARARFDALEGC